MNWICMSNTNEIWIEYANMLCICNCLYFILFYCVQIAVGNLQIPYSMRIMYFSTIMQVFSTCSALVSTVAPARAGSFLGISKIVKKNWLLNCQTLYQFYFGTDWRGAAVDFIITLTPNALLFENKKFVCFDHNAIYTHSSVSTFNW